MLTLLIKPASSLCNLRCKYCFYYDETKNREIAFNGIMAEETMSILIKRCFDKENQVINFAFQGGEPTLAGLEYFKKFIETVNKNNKENIKISYSIQTNGTTIDKNWCSFLKKNNFLVGVSLDGNEKVHNKYRITSSNDGTYKKVIDNIKLLKKAGVEFNVLSVVTEELANNIESAYRKMKAENFRFMQFIPCLDPLNINHKTEYSLTNETYYEFLHKLFNLWYEDFMKGDYFSIRYFDNLYASFVGKAIELCGMQGHCNIQYVIEGDGSVYPCDFYCLDEYRLGNIKENSLEEMMDSKTAKKFIKDSSGYNKECLDCECFKLCKSGCRRYKVNNKYIYCDAFKKFYKEAIEKLEKIKERLKQYNN